MQLEQLECRRPTSPNMPNQDDDMDDATGQEQGIGPSTGAEASMTQQQETEQQNTEKDRYRTRTESWAKCQHGKDVHGCGNEALPG